MIHGNIGTKTYSEICFVLQQFCLMVTSIYVVLEVAAESHFKCQKLRYVMLCRAIPPSPLPPWLEAVCFQEVCSQTRSLKRYNLHPEALRPQNWRSTCGLKAYLLGSLTVLLEQVICQTPSHPHAQTRTVRGRAVCIQQHRIFFSFFCTSTSGCSKAKLPSFQLLKL